MQLPKSVQVLIVPLWNWNSDVIQNLQYGVDSSNRTFMELKLEDIDDCDWIHLSSNRTFMELK